MAITTAGQMLTQLHLMPLKYLLTLVPLTLRIGLTGLVMTHRYTLMNIELGLTMLGLPSTKTLMSIRQLHQARGPQSPM